MLAVEVWKCQWGPVQKDRENDETNVSRPAVWKDMHFLSRRDHVGTNQISTLGKRGIYKVLSKIWIWIHFVWSILIFQDVPNSHFLLVFTVFFQCPHFRRVKTLARFQIRRDVYEFCFEHINHESRHLYNKLNNPFEIGMSFYNIPVIRQKKNVINPAAENQPRHLPSY